MISVLRRFMFQRLHEDTLFGRPIVSLPAFTIKKEYISFSPAERFIHKIVNEFVDKIEGHVGRSLPTSSRIVFEFDVKYKDHC